MDDVDATEAATTNRRIPQADLIHFVKTLVIIVTLFFVQGLAARAPEQRKNGTNYIAKQPLYLDQILDATPVGTIFAVGSKLVDVLFGSSKNNPVGSNPLPQQKNR